MEAAHIEALTEQCDDNEQLFYDVQWALSPYMDKAFKLARKHGSRILVDKDGLRLGKITEASEASLSQARFRRMVVSLVRQLQRNGQDSPNFGAMVARMHDQAEAWSQADLDAAFEAAARAGQARFLSLVHQEGGHVRWREGSKRPTTSGSVLLGCRGPLSQLFNGVVREQSRGPFMRSSKPKKPILTTKQRLKRFRAALAICEKSMARPKKKPKDPT